MKILKKLQIIFIITYRNNYDLILYISDEFHLKRVLVAMAHISGKMKNTADIAKLKFGEDCNVPNDLLFNNVPHAAWVK